MNSAWPALPLEDWGPTYRTLHMWTQIVGKIALALAPLANHYWNVAFQLTPSGLMTQTLPYGEDSFNISFDFLEHLLVVRCTGGRKASIKLEPISVAEFYKRLFEALAELGIQVKVWPVAVEVPEVVKLNEDTTDASYDGEAVQRWWTVMLLIKHVFDEFRCDFVGKCSPVHFFWGAFDLAVTRFNGKRAPSMPEKGAMYAESYSHEVISHGFWPGSGPVQEAAFYAYHVPQAPGFSEARVLPAAAYYHQELGEFILPYEAVRTSSNPAGDLRAFMSSTYNVAANLGKWDRAILER